VRVNDSRPIGTPWTTEADFNASNVCLQDVKTLSREFKASGPIAK
jgi:hypothetical protein